MRQLSFVCGELGGGESECGRSLASARGRETLAYDVVTLTLIIFAIFGAVSLLRRL